METFLIVGGIWFWTLVIIELLVLIFFVENNHTVFALFSIVGFFTILGAFSSFNVFSWTSSHPHYCILGVAGYFLIGTIWVFPKWWLYSQNVLDEYMDAKEKETERRKKGGYSSNYYPTDYKNSYIVQLNLNKNKSRILNWMTFWPFSMISTLLNDFVTRVFRSIFNSIYSYLEKISNQVIAKIENDDFIKEDEKK